MELKKEFEKNFVMDTLGTKQMILTEDGVNDLWQWITANFTPKEWVRVEKRCYNCKFEDVCNQQIQFNYSDNSVDMQDIDYCSYYEPTPPEGSKEG